MDSNAIDWTWIHFLWLSPTLLLWHCATSLLSTQSTVKPGFDALVSPWMVVEPCNNLAMPWWLLRLAGIFALARSGSPPCASYSIGAVGFLFSLMQPCLPLVVPTTLWFGVSNLSPSVEALGDPVYYNSINRKVIMRSWATTLWVMLSGQRPFWFLGHILSGWACQKSDLSISRMLLYCMSVFFTFLFSVGFSF